MMSSFASVLVAKANATPEKVVPYEYATLESVYRGRNCHCFASHDTRTKSIPTISWALLR